MDSRTGSARVYGSEALGRSLTCLTRSRGQGITGHERYRDELRLLYFPRLDPASGQLTELRLAPFEARQLRLHHPSDRTQSGCGPCWTTSAAASDHTSIQAGRDSSPLASRTDPPRTQMFIRGGHALDVAGDIPVKLRDTSASARVLMCASMLQFRTRTRTLVPSRGSGDNGRRYGKTQTAITLATKIRSLRSCAHRRWCARSIIRRLFGEVGPCGSSGQLPWTSTERWRWATASPTRS